MKKTIHPFGRRFFASALKYRSSEELSDPYFIMRLQSVLVLSFLAIVALFIFGLINLGFHAEVAGYYELIAAAALMVNLLALIKWGKIGFSSNIILCLLVPLLFYLMHSGGIDGSGIIWLFVLPPTAFYLTGLRWGVIWMGIMASGLLISAYLQASGVMSSAYDLIFLRQLAICLLMVTIIIYYHEKLGDTARRLAMQRNREEKSLNDQLATSNYSIEEAKVRYQALVESIGDGIIATDGNGKVVLANQAALGLLKLKPKDIIGKTVDVFRVEDEKGHKIPYQDRVIIKVLKTNQKMSTAVTSQYYYVDSAGHRFPVASTQSPIVIDGKNQGAVCVFRDISHEKRLDEAKTELVSLASHQLNTPLTAVSWYAEMLLSGEAGQLTKVQQQYLREIYAGSSKMVDLVNDFLNASRIEMGTFVSHYQPVNLNDIVESILSELSPDVIRRKITIVRKFSLMPELQLDKRLTQIIVQNLLTNAVKYTPERGTITVDIAAEGTGRNGYVRIRVADTGMGIPKAEQANIFHKMYRANNAKQHEAEGTGLGLYIVKSAVDEMHGTIEFSSTEGRGTTFVVMLPLRNTTVTAPSPASKLHRKG